MSKGLGLGLSTLSLLISRDLKAELTEGRVWGTERAQDGCGFIKGCPSKQLRVMNTGHKVVKTNQ